MSKNSIYTFDYFQPKEYRFSLDSVFLAQSVSKHIASYSQLNNLKVLDLCSGTGVIGLELSIHRPELHFFDFIEVQNIYLEYFQQNVSGIHGVNHQKQFNFLNLNYNQCLEEKFTNKYDLILSNPPYFFKDEGLLSPSEFKNRCRFFLDSDFKTLILAIINLLKPDGEAFLLVRPGSHHGRDLLQEIKNYLANTAHKVEIFDEVRGTNVVRLIKKLS